MIAVSSATFDYGATIADRHSFTGRGDNVSPALDWTPPPVKTRQLLLVMDDVDAPLKLPAVHLVALFPPTITHFDEGELGKDNPAIRYIPSRHGRTGYVGPRPLPGHGIHHYGFHLYALDQVVPTDAAIKNLIALLPHLRDHVIASGYLEGVQEG